MKEYSRQGEREVVLERKQAVLLFAGGILALFLVFALGVLIGKNIANLKQGKSQAQTAKEAVFPAETEPVSGATVEPSLARGATAPAVMPATGETAKIMQKIKEQQPPQITGPAKGSTSKPATSSSQASATTSKPSTAPTTPSTTKPATATTTKPVAQKLPNFAIQVAAFPDQATAEELVKKLKGNKWDAYSVPIDIPGKGIWYRVYVGRYDTKALADKALVVFKSKEQAHQDAFVRKME